MENIISVKNLSKSFGGVEVVHDLEFDVKKGEIFAFVGPNGSGKTTTIRCLLKIYQADRGDLKVFGEEYSVSLAPKLGYLPEERGLYVSANVLDTMIYFGMLKGMKRGMARDAALDYLARVGLLEKATQKIQKLSSGQQQKIQLGIAIINSPELLILDEPTKGLDPVNRQLLMDILFELNKSGSTIVFLTHQMDEVEKIANRLLMINKGMKSLYGEVNEVRSQFGLNTIHLYYQGEFKPNPDLFESKVEGQYAELTPRPKVTHDEILTYLVKLNMSIEKYEVAAPSLNEIFINVVGAEK